MFSRGRRSDDTTDGISPWSSEANAPDAPPLTWDTPRSPSDVPGGSPAVDGDGPATTAGSSRTGWVVAACVAVATMAGLVWLWPSDVDDVDDVDAGSDDAPVTTLGTLPPPTTVVDAPTLDERDEEVDEQTGADGAAAGEAAGSAVIERPSVPDVETIDLPAGLPTFAQPFELVMSTQEGLATLSFPSGTLRTTPLDPPASGFGPEGLVVAPDSALVVYGTAALIVDRNGRSTEVDLASNLGGTSPIGWGSVDGTTVFTMLQWTETGVPQLATVGRDGMIRSTETMVSWPVLTASDASLLIGDAGGTYRLAPDGTTSRISDGALVGFGHDHVGLRTCDEQRTCSFSTLDLATGEITEYAGARAADMQRFGGFPELAVVSPDGTMVVVTEQAENGTIGDRILHADGSDFPGGLEAAPTWPWPSLPAWAPDSSGYFRTGTSSQGLTPSLRFTSATGDVVTIGGLPDTVGWGGIRSIDEELPAIEAGSLGIDPIPDIDVGVVGLDRGAAVHIDLGAGSMTTWATPDVGTLPDLFHVDTAVIGVSSSGDVSFRSFAGTVMDSRNDPVDPPGSPRYQGSDDRLVWRPDAVGETYELVPMPFHDVAGRNAWQSIDVGPDAVYGTNGIGGLVYEQGGDIFVSDSSGPQRLTAGELVAIGPATALVHECDDAGACRNVLVDSVGARTPVAGPPGAALPIEPARALEGSFAPDGGAMLVQLPGNMVDGGSESADDREWALVDWATVTTVPAPTPDRGAAVHWTDDSRYAFYLSDDRIRLFDRDAQRVLALDGAGDFDAITLVPLDFAPDAAD